ncbi:hypothetical protein BH23CHL3_BH23CHL3_06430 [soil metagenome]
MTTKSESFSGKQLESEWPLVPLNSLIDPTRGISYGVVQPGHSSTDGIHMVRVNNLTNGRIDPTGALRIARDIEAQYGRTRLKGGEVLLSLVGTLGLTAAVPKAMIGWNVARAIGVIPVNEEVGAKWIDFCLRSPQLQERMSARATTTVQATLNLKDVRELPIPLPPKAVREEIAHILGTLDDKIELNRQMNETLDEIARTLFTSWFINFDPVRAKAEGRQPEGMDADTAALFPDRFVDSELGPIPEGWKWIRFGDIATNIRDGMPTAEIHADLNYIGLEHMPKRSIALTEWESASKVTSNKSRFQETDVLFGKLRPYFHKVGLAPVNGICSTDILVIRPKASDHLAWVLAVASSNEMVKQAIMRSSGTRMPRANWSDLADFVIADPGCKVATMFEERSRPMLGLIKHNVHESRTLAELRDTLLPKLMSGRVRVGEDGTLVGEVV